MRTKTVALILVALAGLAGVAAYAALDAAELESGPGPAWPTCPAPQAGLWCR